MRTTGAYGDRTTSAASKRCLRSCMPAVVRASGCACCYCTFCCTEMTRVGIFSYGQRLDAPGKLIYHALLAYSW